MSEETNLLVSETPKTAQEKEDLQRVKDGEPAGFWMRLGALILDGLLVSLPLSIVVSLFISGLGIDYAIQEEQASGFTFNFNIGYNFENLSQTVTDFLMLVYQLIIPILWTGFTVGKRLMSIRIRRMDGKAVSFGTTFLRYVVAELVYLSPIILFSLLGILGPSIFPALIGLGGFFTLCLYIASAIMVGTREDARAIHDFIAGTQVVRTEK